MNSKLYNLQLEDPGKELKNLKHKVRRTTNGLYKFHLLNVEVHSYDHLVGDCRNRDENLALYVPSDI